MQWDGLPGLRRPAGRWGSGLCQFCLEDSDAAAGFSVLEQKLAALVQAVSGAEGSGQSVTLGNVALQGCCRDLNASGSHGHEQSRLRGRSRVVEGLPSVVLIVAHRVRVTTSTGGQFT